jgi:hypothetical protein
MAILLSTGAAFSSGLPAAHEPELKLLAAAIQEDTDKEEHEKKKRNMVAQQREIELLNMATRMADQQTRFNARQCDYINGYDYVCGSCRKKNCNCDLGF